CMCFFFFSSRRRHTRFSRDWSSDVCSSDLSFFAGSVGPTGRRRPGQRRPAHPTTPCPGAHRAVAPRYRERSHQRRRRMQSRTLGRTGRTVSVIGLGTWQLGADWGDVSEADARAVLDASVEGGVTFFDTADVYGDGRSERIIGQWLRDNPGSGVTVATKMGRRLPQETANYSMENFRAWTDRSRRNLGVDTLDLVQLHCPPTEVYGVDRVFDDLDTLVTRGVTASYGVSVEREEEALAAIARPH